jgi:hypothetical protein
MSYKCMYHCYWLKCINDDHHLQMDIYFYLPSNFGTMKKLNL